MSAFSSLRNVAALFGLVTTAVIPLCGQETSPPIRSAELLSLDQQYQNELREKVDAPLDASIQHLKAAYSATLEDALKKAAGKGELDETIAVQGEAKRFAEKSSVPTVDEEGTRGSIVKYRTAYRAEEARVVQQSALLKQTITTQHLTRLHDLEKEFTKALKIEEAKEVRLQIVALTPPSVSLPAVVVPTAPPPAVSPPAKAKEAPPKFMTSSEAQENPVGTWIFKVQGGSVSYKRTFHEDGTITGEGFRGAGHWQVAERKIIISYPQGEGWMDLPLNPRGTKAHSHNGQPQTAIKVSPKG